MPENAPQPASAGAYAFSFGLPRATVLRLLGGRFTAADYKLYLRTDHWRAVKAQVLGGGRRCALCDYPATQAHHPPRQYRRLFDEDVQDLVPLARSERLFQENKD